MMEIYDVAEALLKSIREENLSFEGKSADSPMQQLWYSPQPVLSQDLEGKINFGNPAAFDFFGYRRDEFIGTLSLRLIPDKPELRKTRDEAIKRLLETGIPEYFDNSPRVRKDGSPIIVPRWVAFRYELRGRYSFGSLILETGNY